MSNTLTALYVIKNEEEWITLSVATVIDYVDKVVIVDNCSTDRTPGILVGLAATSPKVELFRFYEDFDKACEYNVRNWAMGKVTTDWVMPIDADQLMSDGWHKWVTGPMADPQYDAIRFRYEHYVGTYEHIHKSFYEKQKNPELHPDVPLWQTMLFRMRPDLKFRPASDSNDMFMEFHHASPDLSMAGKKFYNCGSATCFHYGFSRRNMMHQSEYRIQRGDYGHEQDKKDLMIARLIASGNPFHFVGDGVVMVDYDKEHVPSVMRDMFGVTYRLALYPDGRIKQRYGVKSGEVE